MPSSVPTVHQLAAHSGLRPGQAGQGPSHSFSLRKLSGWGGRGEFSRGSPELHTQALKTMHHSFTNWCVSRCSPGWAHLLTKSHWCGDWSKALREREEGVQRQGEWNLQATKRGSPLILHFLLHRSICTMCKSHGALFHLILEVSFVSQRKRSS